MSRGDRGAAILEGIQSAQRLHRELDLRADLARGLARIDVFGATLRRGAELLFRPLDGPLGLYLNDPAPGILISTNRELHVQRFTGAHELGHFVLDHRPSIDTAVGLWRGGADGDYQEVAADAFAAEFLLPRWLYVHHARRHAWTSAALSQADVVYQLALRMGASYEATCWGLESHKVLPRAAVKKLLELAPKAIKARALAGIELTNSWANVWVLSLEDAGLLLEGGPEDVFVLRLPEHAAAGYLWGEAVLKERGFEIVDDRRDIAADGDAIGGVVDRVLVVRASEPREYSVRLTEQRPWEAETGAHDAVVFAMDLQGKEKGLSRARRRAIAA